eukprot:10351162-Alexandrium_andersonii.AAC.1
MLLHVCHRPTLRTAAIRNAAWAPQTVVRKLRPRSWGALRRWCCRRRHRCRRRSDPQGDC